MKLNYNVTFDEKFVADELADTLLDKCKILFSNKSTATRSSVIFGDKGLVYVVSYKGNTRKTLVKEWSEFQDLLTIKDKLQRLTGETYNFCAIMKYPDGSAIIKKHRDKEMTKGSQICGISLGATREFKLSPINGVGGSHRLNLTHGSLYCLLPPTNDFWLHEILPSDTKEERYSLTFRNVPSPLKQEELKYCSAILKSGIRKGEKCGSWVCTGELCGRHNK
jgi:hypothetical protein